MQSDSNKICYTCGKQYRYCGRCPEDSKKPFWMNALCSEKCHEIFNICAQYNLGHCSKSEAQELLKHHNGQNEQYHSENINKTIAKIFEDDIPGSVDENPDKERVAVDKIVAAVTSDTKKKRKRADSTKNTEEAHENVLLSE